MLVWHLDVRVLGLWDTQVFGLAPGHAAVQLRITEQCGPHALVPDLGGLALVLQALAAHVAVTARDLERHHHPVTGFQVGDIRPDLLHDPHGFVAQDVALVHERTQHLIQV